MSSFEKLYRKIIEGQSDKNISFQDICQFLKQLGFEMRIRGSHHIFRKQGVEEKINLQKDGNKAKPYQIRQIRKILLYYNLKEKP